ncbi:MAG: TetR/AcrR family transcriptional regulator [Solirubrobacteraceae bacterium]
MASPDASSRRAEFQLDEEPSVRERIHEAALACFGRHGIRRTTMDDIAREAGLSRPAIYYYFENKDSLIVETVLRQQAASHRRQTEQLAGRVHGIDAIVEAASLGIELALADPASQLLTRPESERLTAFALRSDGARELQAAFWSPLLADARRRGELRTDLGDDELILWIIFVQFSVVTNGSLFGWSDSQSIRRLLERLLAPALRASHE